jgi:hypothetical protein
VVAGAAWWERGEGKNSGGSSGSELFVGLGCFPFTKGSFVGRGGGGSSGGVRRIVYLGRTVFCVHDLQSN